MLDATDGRGVDVAFDAVSGDVTMQTFRCMAFNGRHILAGFASGIEQEDEGLVPRPVLFGNFSLVGVCHAYVDDPRRVQAARAGSTSRRTTTASNCTRGSWGCCGPARCVPSWTVSSDSTTYRKH